MRKLTKWAAMNGFDAQALKMLRQVGSDLGIVAVKVNGDDEVSRLVFLHPHTANSGLP